MLSYYHQGKIPLEKIVQKMSHAVADCFKIKERGFVREGYFADLVIIDLKKSTLVTKKNILYKCGWSPFEGTNFPSSITHTFVNGNLIWENGIWNEFVKGKRLLFNR
jgi:dihydroorotase